MREGGDLQSFARALKGHLRCTSFSLVCKVQDGLPDPAVERPTSDLVYQTAQMANCWEMRVCRVRMAMQMRMALHS